MDNSGRNPDRTRLLRTLSRAVTGWQAEILQRSVQGQPSRPCQQAKGDGRRPGSEVGDPLDLRHRCVRCGEVMPPKTNARRMYCSVECARLESQADRIATYNVIRDDLIKDRRCQICDGPIPHRKFRGSKFCSKKCEKSLDNPAQRLKVSKVCPHCSETFHPITAEQVHCGHRCAGKAAALAGRNLPPLTGPPREHINCLICGTRFQKKERRTIYCSRACWHQSQRLLTPARLDRILGIAPPRRFPLTAARLDRVFKETRPKRLKRPFNCRLTPDRLDRLLAKVSRPA